ncbi:MAG: D-tyrosyl-tRNA(Tyr) deacylase [Gammaproteobacteria bacterium]|nr:D-tyrosyl-tRNA(Tyr) deacylase [Gammaproteobacteria bacterium]
MIALIQRVSQARVVVAGETTGAIERGILALIGVVREDGPANAERLLQRLLGYRIFPDGQGKMNLSLQDIQGGLLLVPQFTLAADTQKGMRPSFTPAAPPQQGRALFEQLLKLARERHQPVASGVFGADMQVSLCNDGPVTFWLEG